MQVLLKWKGYRLSTDGVFGQETYRVLREFRAQRNLSGDTVCDAETWKTLLK